MSETRISYITGALLALWLATAGPLWAQDSPDQTLRSIIEGLQENRPQVFWEKLPVSYQRDVHSIIHEAAEKTDPELWNQGFKVLHKVVQILDEKREFILGHPMVAAQLEAAPLEVDNSVYDQLIGLLKLITTSEVSSIETLKTLDVGQFLAGTVSQLMVRFRTLAELAPGAFDDLDKMDTSTVTLVSSDGNRAVVRIASEDETEEQEMVLVEGKWVPADIADEWDEGVAEWRQQVSEIPLSRDSEEKVALMATMQGFEQSLDPLLAADTEEEFNSALENLIGTVMMQFGAMAAEGER